MSVNSIDSRPSLAKHLAAIREAEQAEADSATQAVADEGALDAARLNAERGRRRAIAVRAVYEARILPSTYQGALSPVEANAVWAIAEILDGVSHG
jgi:hypothetical protein